MIRSFRRSDSFFCELVHDAEKRASAIEAYRNKRRVYFWAGILFGVAALPNLFPYPESSHTLLVLRSATLVMCMASCVLCLSIHTYFDNRIKLLLYVEEKEADA